MAKENSEKINETRWSSRACSFLALKDGFD
jgi:hypothetical protein